MNRNTWPKWDAIDVPDHQLRDVLAKLQANGCVIDDVWALSNDPTKALVIFMDYGHYPKGAQPWE